MVALLIESFRQVVLGLLGRVGAATREASRPAPMLLGLAVDAFRSRRELLAENALLRQQLIVVAPAVKRPKLRAYERGFILLLAALTQHWRNALLLVRPETVLRLHQVRGLARRRSARLRLAACARHGGPYGWPDRPLLRRAVGLTP